MVNHCQPWLKPFKPISSQFQCPHYRSMWISRSVKQTYLQQLWPLGSEVEWKMAGAFEHGIFFGELKGDRTCNISENAKARTVKGSFFPQKFIARRFFYLDLVSVIVWTLETTLWLTDMIEFLVWYFWCLNWTQFDQLFFISPCFFEISSYDRCFVHFQY